MSQQEQMPEKRGSDLEHCDEMIAWARNHPMPGNCGVDLCDADWNAEKRRLQRQAGVSITEGSQP